MKTQLTLSLLLALLVSTLYTIAVNGQGGATITVNGADGQLALGFTASSDLQNKLAPVPLRAYSLDFEAGRYYDLPPIPAALQAVLNTVPPLAIFDFVNANKIMPLQFPKALVNDQTPPQLSSTVGVLVSGTTVTFTIKANEFVSLNVGYGTQPGLPDAIQTGNPPQVQPGRDLALTHLIGITGLNRNATYYYRIYLSDLSGNQFTSPEASFRVGDQPTVLPSLSTARPNQGSNSAPNTLYLSGANFANGAVVTLGSAPLATTFVNANEVRATVPAGVAAGIYDLAVVNPDGGRALLSGAYTVIDPTATDDLSTQSYNLWLDPAAAHAQSPVKVGVTVYRQGGNATLRDVKVRFYQGASPSGTLIGEGIIPALSKNSAENTFVTWTPSAAGVTQLYAVIDPDNTVPEFNENNNTVGRTIEALLPAADQKAPRVDTFTINGGALETDELTISLTVAASDPPPGSGVARLLFVELAYSESANQWVRVRDSGWLPYATAHTNFTWTVEPSSGLKHLQAWVADSAGNVSDFSYNQSISYVPQEHRIVATERRTLYRIPLNAGASLNVRLEPLSGDPDLYIWPPDTTNGRPPWVSNLRSGIDDWSIASVPVNGIYVVEVFGFTEATYRLIISQAAAVTGAGVLGGVDPTKTQFTAPLKPNDATPSDQFALPSPGQTLGGRSYLPLIRR